MIGDGLNPLYFALMLPGLLLGMYAQFKLKSTFARYSEEPTLSGFTGAEAAREILDRSGLASMPVEMTPGQLTDHYDPVKKALFLSEINYYGRSIAAVGVAAHEAGHALQHKAAYFPLHLRMAMVPITRIASPAAIYLAMFGFALNMFGLVKIALVAFAIVALFQLVTLPVEFDASSRAKKQLLKLGLVREGEEARGVSRVLSAAAMTYVAAMVTAALQLLYFFLRARSGRTS